MPPSQQQNFDRDELLDDVGYVNRLNKREIKRLDKHLRERIADASLPKSVADSLLNEISTHLGRLHAKVKLTDKALRSIRTESRFKTKLKIPTVPAVDEPQAAELALCVSQFADNVNLLPLECSADGINYCWSGARAETEFVFSVDRRTPLEMQILLFAIIKPEYSKQLKIFVDGHHLKHGFSVNGSLFVVSCILPVAINTGQTTIGIVLPATHSPLELGTSTDDRKLGIAINEIRFVTPRSWPGRLMKRLKLIK